MPVESEADIAAFFSEDDFASPAFYRAGGTGPEIRVAGLFDQAYAQQNLGALAGEGTEIAFRCLAAALPAAQQGDTLRVDGTTWRVRSARPDGNGTVILILAR